LVIVRRTIRYLAAIATGLTAVILAAAVAPAALAYDVPPPPYLDNTGVVAKGVVGGMLGWQIALIAIAAAVLASIGAVTIDRARATGRPLATLSRQLTLTSRRPR